MINYQKTTTRVQKNLQSGFTIIELMIATAVFSLVLMICLAGILTISRMYYQGTLQAKTQNKTRQVVDDIADQIRYSNSAVSSVSTLRPVESPTPAAPNSNNPSENYVGYFCISDVRYLYILDHKQTPKPAPLVSSASNSAIREVKSALIREKLKSGESCSSNISLDRFNQDNGESSLLDNSMRLLDLHIRPIADSGTFEVSMIVAFGDQDLINYSSVDQQKYVCNNNTVTRTYCAVAPLTVVVDRRF